MNQIDIFGQNAEVFIGAEDLKEKLAAGKRLRVKLGVDPTRPDLTFAPVSGFGASGGFDYRRLHRMYRRSQR